MAKDKLPEVREAIERIKQSTGGSVEQSAEILRQWIKKGK